MVKLAVALQWGAVRKVPHKPLCYRTGAGWYTNGEMDVLNFTSDVGFGVLNFTSDVADIKHAVFSLIFTTLWPRMAPYAYSASPQSQTQSPRFGQVVPLLIELWRSTIYLSAGA